MAGNSADIGIRVFLDDAASGALGSINGALGRMASSTTAASRAMGGLSGAMAGVGVAVGFAAAFLAFGAAIKYSVDAASAFQQAMFSVAVATHVPLDAAMQYSSTLMNLAAASTYTSTEIADGIVQMGRAGFSIHDIFTQMAQSGAGFVSVGGQMVPVMSSIAQAGIALGIATRSTAVQGFTMLAQTMAAYNLPANQALHTANLLQFAFEHQRGSVSELTSGLSALTPQAAQLNIPLNQIVAALDVVGPAMKSTSTAGTALRYALANVTEPSNLAISALASLGLITVSSVSPAMQKFASSLLATGAVSADFVRQNDNSVAGLKSLFAAAQQAGIIPLDAKFNEWAISSGLMKNAFFDANGKAKDLTSILQILNDKLGSMPDAERLAYLKDIFSVRGGQGIDILLTSLSKYSDYLKQLTASQDNAGGAMARWQQVMGTFGGAMAGLKSSITDLATAIGIQLLPVLTDIATRANGFITSIRNMVGPTGTAASSFLKLGLAMSGVGLVATIVALAFASVGTGIMIFIGIVAGVAVGVVLLTVGITLLVNWFHNLSNSSALVRSIIGNLGAMFNQLGSDIRSGVTNALTMVQQALALTGLKMHDLEMAGMLLGAIIGVVFAVLLGIVVAVVTGIIYALVTFVAGIAMMVAGVIQMLSGFAQFFVGLFNLIKGIITGNGALINQAWHQMWDGIVTATKGLFLIVLGLIVAIGGTIVMAVYGIILGIINWFVHLAAVLVGHSIIPDMLNAIRNAFISILSGIVGWIGGWVNSIISFFVRLGAQVVAAVVAAWNFVRSVITIALAAVVAVVSSAAASVVAHFISLGSQVVSSVTSAFNRARAAVSNAMSSILAVIISAGASIVAFATAQWNTFKAVVQFGIALAVSFVTSGAASMVARIVALGASIGSTISSAMANFRNLVSSGIASAVSIISSGAANMAARVVALGASIGSTISTAMANFRNTVSSGMATAASTVSGGVAHIVSIVSGLPGKLFSWGKNAMQSFADGLTSAISSVTSAVSNAAGKVADFLGHLSPAKVGPLANDDQWMPNMMRMMASGIDSHAPLLQNALSKATSGMASVPQMARTGAPTTGTGGGGGGVTGGNQIIQLVVDGRVLSQVVMNNLTGQMQLNGGGRAFR